MNLVGKIFIVLILILSVLFLGLSVAVYATHTNWMKVASDKEAKLTQAELRKTELKEQLDRTAKALAAEKIFRQDTAIKLEGERDKRTQERNDFDRQLASLTEQRDDSLVTLKVTQEEIAKLRLEITGIDAAGNRVGPGLRQTARDAEDERDQIQGQLVQKLDELHQARNQYQSATERMVDLSEQLGLYQTAFNRLGPPFTILYDGPVRNVPGVVLNVGGNGLIEVSLGEDDGLQKGHTLEVYRGGEGGRYLGRVEVTETWTDRAVCSVLPGFRVAPIQRDDRVTPTLN
ncbi:MAG: hypothetical protein ACYTG0_18960 [Planctomycetota bacterium]|jgi:hypothetical protein